MPASNNERCLGLWTVNEASARLTITKLRSTRRERRPQAMIATLLWPLESREAAE